MQEQYIPDCSVDSSLRRSVKMKIWSQVWVEAETSYFYKVSDDNVTALQLHFD